MVSKQVYYHWDRLSGYKPGEIKPKGLWGKYILDRPLTATQAARELIYEQVRKENYQERPSRLNCVFMCANEESAKLFGQSQQKSMERSRGQGFFDRTLYEVEIVDKTAKKFIANWDRMAQKQSNYACVIAYAEDYWRASDVPLQLQELVIESDIKILKKARLTKSKPSRTRR